jgi:type VI secretion system protein ImpF
MARVPLQDRLQPSLLDRLTDRNPSQQTEALERRVLSMRELRQSVLRDVAWLLNTGNLDSVLDLEGCDAVADSTLNYGIPHLAGTTSSDVDTTDMERRLREAIWNFEPRILRESVKVRFVLNENQLSHNALSFTIEGMLWAEPVPLHLYLKTELDLEMGTFSVTEQDGPGEA